MKNAADNFPPDHWGKMLLALVQRAGSERRAAALFNISQSSFNAWMRSRALPDDDQAAVLARELRLDPAYVLAVVNLERSRRKECEREVTDAWRRIADKFRNAAMVAGAAVAITMMGGFTNNSFAGTSAEVNTHCRDKRRRILGVTL